MMVCIRSSSLRPGWSALTPVELSQVALESFPALCNEKHNRWRTKVVALQGVGACRRPTRFKTLVQIGSATVADLGR